jgi:ubiquinone/menaquinone biosynthesis C-methylase UbiE
MIGKGRATMTSPGWMIDEIAHAGGEHLDPAYVPGYDEKSQTDPAVDLEHVRELGLASTHTLIDLGAGTGTFAIAAAPHCARVIAVDVSRQMLGVLERKLAETGIGNVDLVHAGFLGYRHEGELADVVYTRHALHHLPDFWKVVALNRIAAMLKPGGKLYIRDLIFSVEPSETEEMIESWLSRASSTSARGWTRPELEEHVREEHSTYTWLFEPMLTHAGFDIMQSYEKDSKFYAAYSCVKRPG